MNSPMVFEGSLGNRQPGGWLWGRTVPLLLIGLWALLRPLAAASPPDPTWIAGIYDEADFDDVVIHIGLLASVSDGSGLPSLAPDSDARPVPLSGLPGLVCKSSLTLQDRSPPVL